MRRAKRFAALLLCGVMALNTQALCVRAQGAEDSGAASDYEEHVSFTMTSYATTAGTDYTSDDFYKYVSERFNTDIEVLANDPTEAAAKIRLWIGGGTLPNCANWEDFNFSEYYDYVDQGLLKPLPDGWEEKWPDLARMVQLSGYAEPLKVDGRTYAIPHAINGTFLKQDPVIWHIALYYRQDWAEQVGMADMGSDGTVKLSELKEYLQKVKDAGLTSDGAWLSGDVSNLMTMFEHALGVRSSGFWEYEDGFRWNPEYEKEGWTTLVKTMREWYQEGLIDPDYATLNDFYDSRSALQAGTLAATYDTGVWLAEARNGYVDATGSDREDIQQAHIVADDGTSTLSGTSNYWTVQIFAPETEDVVMERVLDVMNWVASFEGFCSIRLGIPGVDWTMDEDQNITVINKDAASAYNSATALQLLGFCGDDFLFSGLFEGVEPVDIEDMMKVFDAKEKGTILPLQTNYTIYSSETKRNYSVSVSSKVAELVGGTEDIETAWDQFIEDNRAMWEPLQNELNEYYVIEPQ